MDTRPFVDGQSAISPSLGGHTHYKTEALEVLKFQGICAQRGRGIARDRAKDRARNRARDRARDRASDRGDRGDRGCKKDLLQDRLTTRQTC